MNRILRIAILIVLSNNLFTFSTMEKGEYHIFYVSSSMGNDNNSGLSELSPKQHISAIQQKSNVCIRLKCDDVFFEQLQGYYQSRIESYGEGGKPVLCGFKVLINSDAWEPDEQSGLWRLDLKRNDSFGGMGNGDELDDRVNNVGFIYDAENDTVYGHLVQRKEHVIADGDFFISPHANIDQINEDTFRYIYWKKSEDPRKMGKLCFPMALVAVRVMNHCTIRDIAIVGFSKFGIAHSSHFTVENCQIDLIGGALQIGKRTDWVRYGNGIEFWWNYSNNTIRNCLISRTYDCGTSIQANGVIDGSPSNIHFENNRFYHCRQAFEFFLNPTNDYKPNYKNCSFTGNLCFEMGENEFSSPEPRDANLLTYDLWSKNIDISGNTFWGASHFFGSCFPQGMKNNTIYIYEGQYVHLWTFSNPQMIIARGKRAISSYRIKSGDNSIIKIVKRGKTNTQKIEKQLWKQLDWKPIDLHLDRLSINATEK